jgi:hypothetical protein
MAERSKKYSMHIQKLKLGLLLDSFNIFAWEYNVIQHILNKDSGEFKLVILNKDASQSAQTRKNTGVYAIFNRIDEKIFTKDRDPFASKDGRELLASVPVLKVHLKQAGITSFLNEEDIKTLSGYHLDIVIKFGFENLQLENLNISKYGIWFYYHGDDRIMRGGPPGFWEVVENWPEASSALLAVGGKFSPRRVLFRSNLITYPFSPARHRSHSIWATPSFLARQIDLLQQLGEERYCQATEKFNTTLLPKIKKYEAPSNVLAIKSISKIILRLIKEFILRTFYVNQWFLLFSLKKELPDNFGEFIKLTPPKEKFWADPHTIQANGKYFIFIEEFLSVKNKGHISVIELDQLGNWKAPVKVLERDYHLSYPFIFEWNTKFYMIPESHENRSIDLYECIEFPYGWRFKQCLMQNISAVDTTLLHFSDKWWLFTAMAENEAAVPNVELFLFYSDDLFSGNWKPHLQNPVISDIKSARPAGSLFMKDGKLFRPSQDCSKMYGYGFDLNEIELLSETEYRERKTFSVRPNWDKSILATHTYANCGNLTVIDVFRRTLKIG